MTTDVGGTSDLLRVANATLREREQVLRAIFDSALDAMLLFDDHGRFVDVNPAACSLTGLAYDALVGRSILDLAAPGYTAGDDWRTLVEKGSVRGVFALLRPDGERRDLELGAVANITPGLHLARLRDVTERRLADEALRSSERSLEAARDRYRRIVETTSDGVWLLDAELDTTFVSERMAQMLGYTPDEMMGRSLFGFLDEDTCARVRARQAARRAGTRDTYENCYRKKDGSKLWAVTKADPFLDEEGRFTGTLGLLTDVTEQRNAEAALRRSEEQLRQAQKLEAIGSLAGGVAHDFNNLLSVILSYTSLLSTDLKPGDPLQLEIAEIHTAGLRAADLTRQLLAFSRQQTLRATVVDVNQVLIGIERMLKRLLGADVVLSLLTAPDLGKAYADVSQLEQVIMNLVVNARDAMPRGGNLTIETSNVVLDAEYAAHHHGVTPGPYVVMSVTDTGMGMTGETIKRIFEPFFTTKELGKGTGLGLSTVYGIVQQTGGHVWVYSEPGIGTTFKVYLPRTDRPIVEATPARMRIGSSFRGSETVLVVEDEDQVRAVMLSILRKQGYNVLEAQNGGEAFLLSEKLGATIHLLVTDVVMPRMSGRELAERVLVQRPDVKVLYTSGYSEDATIHHGMLESGIAFLQKPLLPEALAMKVREVLDGPPRR